MSSLKCPQCGLVNFATDTTCKRCRAPLAQYASAVTTPLEGIVLEDGYVLPPPPSVGLSGVWRDRSVLVMSKGGELPARCVKCNQPTSLRLKKKLTWHHPALYILVFVALLIYLIVAMILRKSATVQLGLCEEHLAKRRLNIIITLSMVVLGFAGFVVGAMYEDLIYVLIGFLLLIAAVIYALVAVKIVSASKIDDRFVWLTGVNKDYLNELPQFPGV
ncbi:MAG: zinc finger Ran-binding domain-containing protein [Acidobacteriota bacterium]|nr:zinc finger Ran-binding domain-containing protein [Acidobacteriota bacterium]